MLLVAMFRRRRRRSAQARLARAGIIDGVVPPRRHHPPRRGAGRRPRRARIDRWPPRWAKATAISASSRCPRAGTSCRPRSLVSRLPTVSAAVVVGTTTAVIARFPIAAISQTVEVVGSATIVLARRHAVAERLDWRQGARSVRARRRLAGFAAPAGEHHRSAGRRQHQGRTSEPGGRPARAGHAGRSLDRPDPGLAARRRDRFGRGAAESVRGRVRPVLVGPGRHSDAAGGRRVEGAAQQHRSDVPHQPRLADSPSLGIGWWAPRIEAGGPLIKGRLFLEQTAQYPLQRRRRPEPAAGRVAHLEMVQLVYARRRQPVAAAFAGRDRRRLPERVRTRDARHVHAARRRPSTCTCTRTRRR